MDRNHSIEGVLLDESVTYTLVEFSQMCVIPKEMVFQMIDYGIVEPDGETQEQWVFHYQSVERAQKAIRLQKDLEINWSGISLALDLIDEVNELREMVRQFEREKNK